jgi:peptide/nickel transport system substrate-binding protein
MDDGSGRDRRLSREGLTRAELLRAGAGLAAAPALLALAACGGSEASGPATTSAATTSGAPRRGGTIHAAYGGDQTEVVDVFGTYTDISWARGRQMWEPLVEPDPESEGTRLVLAEAIEPNADGSEWTITLRDGVRWHDGSPFTADDVVYTIKTYLDPKVASSVAGLLSGADPSKVVKVDARTVRVGLAQPVGDFVETLGADGGAFMVKNGARGTDAMSLGTGPFQLVAFNPGQSSKLAPSQYYERKYGGDGPYVDALDLVVVTSEEARFNALRDGQIEYASYISPATAKPNLENPSVVLHRSERGAPYVFNLNMRVKPFDDARVRLAFKLACNRQQLVDNALLGFGTVGNDMYGLGTPVYPDDVQQRPYDPEQARSLLQSAGAAGLEVPIYVFDYGIGDQGMSAATLYAEQLKEVDVEAKPVRLSYSEFRENLDKYTKTIPLYSYLQSDLPAPVLWTYIYAADSAFNYTGWIRPEWEARFREARKTLDANARNALYAELQRELWEDGGEIVWGFSSTITGLSPRLRDVVDVPDNYSGAPLFKDAWLA